VDGTLDASLRPYDEQPQGVHHDMSLSTLDLLAPVMTVRAAEIGGLERPAVDAAVAGSQSL
jgi:hypothetical protein